MLPPEPPRGPLIYAFDSHTNRPVGFWLCVEINEDGGIWQWHDLSPSPQKETSWTN